MTEFWAALERVGDLVPSCGIICQVYKHMSTGKRKAFMKWFFCEDTMGNILKIQKLMGDFSAGAVYSWGYINEGWQTRWGEHGFHSSWQTIKPNGRFEHSEWKQLDWVLMLISFHFRTNFPVSRFLRRDFGGQNLVHEALLSSGAKRRKAEESGQQLGWAGLGWCCVVSCE